MGVPRVGPPPPLLGGSAPVTKWVPRVGRVSPRPPKDSQSTCFRSSPGWGSGRGREGRRVTSHTTRVAKGPLSTIVSGVLSLFCNRWGGIEVEGLG